MGFPELTSFADFAELMNFSELAKLMEKEQTLEKKETRLETPRKRVPAPQTTPICEVSRTSMVWNISIGQLGLAVWLCSLPTPAHLLISRT